MTMRPPAIALALACVFLCSIDAPAKEKAKVKPKAQTSTSWAEGAPLPAAAPAGTPAGKLERATFGGGCFWSIEAIFERIPGVKSAVSGYAGGSVVAPSYEMVCTGETGHAEVVMVEYDPAVVSYEALLKVFFKAHDPTTPDGQGADFGPQYRSVIFYQTDDQAKAARALYKDYTARRVFRAPIVTELLPLTAFFPAEPYHQDYYDRHKSEDYCLAVIAPKLRKLKLR